MHSRSVGIRRAYRNIPLFILSLIFATICSSQEVAPSEPPPEQPDVSSRALEVTRHVPGRLLVILDPETSETERERIVAGRGGRSVGGDPRFGLHVVELPARADEMAALRAFRNHPRVLAAELDEIVEHSQITPNDPNYPAQAHLRAILGPSAWVKTTGSPSVIVAVIDTGVNGNHPDLAGRLLPGWNTYDNNADYSDVYGHGTKVAGTITTASNNGVGVASICWNCMILPIRASYPSGSASFSTLAAGLIWAADHGARVANISYSVSSSLTVGAAAQYFMQKGGLVFSSAGNYSTNDPAPDNPSIVTVSAVDPATKNLYSWSNYGNNIDVTAPGCAGSTTLMNLAYGSGCGTSYSSPIAAGVAALIFSVNPSLSPEAALAILKQSSTDLGDPGWDIRFGAGLVDASKAVTLAAGESAEDTQAPQVSVIAPASGVKAKGSLAASASVSDAEGTVESVVFKVNSTAVCTFAAAPYSCSIDTTAFPDGTATFTVVATDNCGNATSVQSSFTIANADTVKPVVNLVSPASGAAVNGTVAIAFSASDDVGVTGITVLAGSTTVCSVAGSATSCLWDTKGLPNGSVQLSVTARDAAGNVQTASATVVVNNPDSAPPTVAILAPAAGATVNGTVAISFNATDNTGVVSAIVTANGATLCSISGPASSCSWITTQAANGAVAITVTARDAAGNTGSAAVNVVVANPDVTKPSVSILSPSSGATVSGTTAIAFAASDNVGVSKITVTAGTAALCTLAGSATSCSWDTKLVANGQYPITVTASDAAGNSQVCSVNVTVSNSVAGDTEKPVVGILAPGVNAAVTGTVKISFSASDNKAVTGITVNVGTLVICSVPGTATACYWKSSLTPDGPATITVTATDAAGNTASALRPVIARNADLTAPTVAILAPASAARVSGSVVISFAATDNVAVKTIKVTIGGQTICDLPGTATACTWDTTKFPNANHTFVVTAQDAALNTRTASRYVQVLNTVP